MDTEENFLRVGAGTSAQGVAQAIAHAIQDKGEVHLRAIGAGAINQATKGLTIARGYVAARGGDLWYSSGFVSVQGRDGTEISALVFRARCLQLPKPGSIGLVKLSSTVGKWIRFGEWLLDGRNTYQHAFVVLDDETIIEAQPGGAVIVPLTSWHNARYNDSMPLTDAQRAAIVAAARSLEGVPYGWLDYASLVLMKFHLRLEFVKRRVNDKSHDICSQLADLAYEMAGVHLFAGKVPGDVTPGDLGALFDKQGW